MKSKTHYTTIMGRIFI